MPSIEAERLRKRVAERQRRARIKEKHLRDGVPDTGTKRCVKCGEVKSVTEFSINRSNASGRAVYCAPCDALLQRQGYAVNIESRREYARNRWKENPNSAWANRLYRYGMRTEDFERIWADQDGACAICRLVFEDRLVACIDHDHESGAVRGLLCAMCNGGLGMLGDDQSRLLAALAYLERVGAVKGEQSA